MESPKPIAQMFSYFAVVHDPRHPHPTMLHSLEAMITMTIRATMCGAHHWLEIEQWGMLITRGDPSGWTSNMASSRTTRATGCRTRADEAPAGFYGVDERVG